MHKFSSLINFILHIVISFKYPIILQIVIRMICAFDTSFRPYLVKIMLDRINLIQLYNSTASKLLLWPTTIYICTSLFILIILRFNDYIYFNFTPKIKKEISFKLISVMIDRPYSLYQNKLSGDISNKLNDLITNLPHIIQIIIDQFFGRLLSIIIAVFALYQINPKFSFAMIIWILLFFIFSFKLAKKTNPIAKESAGIKSKIIGHIIDIINNIINVKLFLGKNHELRLLKNIFLKFTKTEQKLGWVFLKAYSLQGVLFIIFQFICLQMLILGVNNNSITTGDFALVIILNISITDYLLDLSKTLREFINLIGSTNKALELIKFSNKVKDKSHYSKINNTNATITFNDVYFNYENTTPIFNGISITIPHGQKVGLVGYSGSGKTTFTNLILRLFDITKGEILINNHSINEITQESLRKIIGLIPQNPCLFHRSIIDNIRYGEMNANYEEVIKASKLAHAHDFIVNLPQKYNSLVGERGIKLSGGQCQRIAIARVILQNPPILIFDEATSQLDSLTEKYIQESLYNLIQNKTAIIIAHRLSTLLNMDRILVFEKGRIIGDGTHKELLNNNKIYKVLWETQIGGFLPIHKKANSIKYPEN